MTMEEYIRPYAKLAGANCNSVAGSFILNDQRRILVPICYGDRISDEIDCSNRQIDRTKFEIAREILY